MPLTPPSLRPRARHAVLAGFAAAVTGAAIALVAPHTSASASEIHAVDEVVAVAVGPAVVTSVAQPVTAHVTSAVEQAATATTRLLEELAPPASACPVPGSEFIDSWGFARSGGRRHKGVDMMAPYGVDVLAPVAGTIRPSNSSLGGLGFYLTDVEGNTYFGSHLATLDVTDGWVEAGTRIGSVGTTGNASTPHLHFEIMLAGSGSVNPFAQTLAWCLPAPVASAPVPVPAAAF